MSSGEAHQSVLNDRDDLRQRHGFAGDRPSFSSSSGARQHTGFSAARVAPDGNDADVEDLEPERGPLLANEAKPWEARVDSRKWVRLDGLSVRPTDKAGVSRDSVVTFFVEGKETQVILLEHDCYSLAVVATLPLPCALLAPVASAWLQLSVLYFLAYSRDTAFDEGRWLQPWSVHWGLNMMKVMAIFVAIFKASTELQHARQLYRALLVGEFDVAYRRRCGWLAVCLQYLTALSVLFVSLSVVLGSTTSVNCILKIFSVFVIVDMDNLAARFSEGLFALDFEVRVNPEKLQAIRKRGQLVGGPWSRTIFLLAPVGMICALWVLAMCLNTLPLTLIKFGKVENLEPPKMVIDIDGCCPPILELQHTGLSGTSAACSVMILAKIPDGRPAVAPTIHWIALEAQSMPISPSSLQILEGQNGDSNPTPLFGSLDSTPTQALYWLQKHDYHQSVYSYLLKKEKLYKRTMAFEATFVINGLEAGEKAYIVYVAAQNPETLALSEQPAQSAPLLTSSCAPFCKSCDFMGSNLCDSGRCMQGSHYYSGKCFPCVENCDFCELHAGSLDKFDTNSTAAVVAAGTIACDPGGCRPGFGLKDGQCQACTVAGCQSCDGDPANCMLCHVGLGMDANRTCQECAAPHCRCVSKGGCEACEDGWGPSGNHTCAKCAEGCGKCSFSSRECTECLPGYWLDQGSCRRCVPHCKRCSATGEGQCDECQPGFRYDAHSLECRTCKVARCQTCDEDGKCSECNPGSGLTVEGRCESCGSHCSRCGSIDDCSVCHSGYVAVKGICWACADRCVSCDEMGPGLCDHCLAGFRLRNATCEPTVV